MRDPKHRPWEGDVLNYQSKQLVGDVELYLLVISLRKALTFDAEEVILVNILIYDYADTWLDFFIDAFKAVDFPEDDDGYMMSLEVTLDQYQSLVEGFTVIRVGE